MILNTKKDFERAVLEEEVKESCYTNDGYKDAQEALAKIKEIK